MSDIDRDSLTDEGVQRGEKIEKAGLHRESARGGCARGPARGRQKGRAAEEKGRKKVRPRWIERSCKPNRLRMRVTRRQFGEIHMEEAKGEGKLTINMSS